MTVSAARPMCSTASSNRCSSRASSPSIASPRRAATGRRRCQPPQHLVTRLAGPAPDRPPRSPRGRRRASWRPGPTVDPAFVQRVGAVGELQRVIPLAFVRHHVGEVVAAARLQVDVDDVVGDLRACPTCVAASFQIAGRRLDPSREQQRDGTISWRCFRAGGGQRASDPLRAATVAEHDPRPAEAVHDVECEPEARASRSTTVRHRCSPARYERRRGADPVHGCARRRSTPRPASANQARARLRRRSAQPGVGARLEREGADAFEQPVAERERGVLVVDDHE